MASHRFHVTVNPLRHPACFALVECNPRRVATERLLDSAEKWLTLQNQYGAAFDAWLNIMAQHGGVVPGVPFGTMLGAPMATLPTGAGHEPVQPVDRKAAEEMLDAVMDGFK